MTGAPDSRALLSAGRTCSRRACSLIPPGGKTIVVRPANGEGSESGLAHYAMPHQVGRLGPDNRKGWVKRGGSGVDDGTGKRWTGIDERGPACFWPWEMSSYGRWVLRDATQVPCNVGDQEQLESTYLYRVKLGVPKCHPREKYSGKATTFERCKAGVSNHVDTMPEEAFRPSRR